LIRGGTASPCQKLPTMTPTHLVLAMLTASGLSPLEEMVRYTTQAYPEASVVRDERYHEVTIRWKTKEWIQTSGSGKDGVIAGARRTIGPVEDGFILWVAEHPGPYDGIGKRPQIMKDRAWKVYLGLIEDKTHHRHTLVNLSFTEKTDPAFLARIQEMVKERAAAEK
jgi:hypothetical protein